MQLFSNNARTKLSVLLPIGGTSMEVTLGEGVLFNAPTVGDFELLTIFDNVYGLYEIVKVTARSGDVFTIERAQEGTTEREWPIDSPILATVTKATLENFLKRTGGVMLGAVGIVAGLVSAPGLYVSSDATTGLYQSAAGSLSIAISGVEAFKFGTATNISYKDFSVEKISPVISLNKTDGNVSEIQFQTGSGIRWGFGTTNSPETGSNVGSDLQIGRYDDTNTIINVPFKIERDTGAIRFTGGIMTMDGYTVWHANNDGPTSGLNADLLDGLEASAFGQLSSLNIWTINQTVQSITPAWVLDETDATATNKVWAVRVQDEIFRIELRTDDQSSAASAITIDRTGQTVDAIGLLAPLINVSGDIELTSSTGIRAIRGNADNSRVAIAGGSNYSILNGAYISIEGVDYGGVGLGGNILFNTPSGKGAIFNTSPTVSNFDPSIIIKDSNNGDLGNSSITGKLEFRGSNDVAVARLGRLSGNTRFVIENFENSNIVFRINGSDQIVLTSGGAIQSPGVEGEIVPYHPGDAGMRIMSAGNINIIIDSNNNQTGTFAIKANASTAGTADSLLVISEASGNTTATLSAVGDGKLVITADTTNTDEGAHPSIRFQQDNTASDWRLGNGFHDGDAAVTWANDLVFTVVAGTGSKIGFSPDNGANVYTMWHSGNVTPRNLWVTKTSAYTAVNGDQILANSSGGAFTITLPASPTMGMTVTVVDAQGTAASNNITIARNGQNILGLAENLVLNVANATAELVFFNASRGWVVIQK